MSDFKLLQKVINALGEAKEGDEELDVRISVALGELQSGSAKLLRLFVEEGYDWPMISNLLDEQVPPYTTSLDASVPGESIVGVLFSRKRGRWAAIHRAADGREEGPVWASTEALARRAAGLSGYLSQQRASRSQPAEPGLAGYLSQQRASRGQPPEPGLPRGSPREHPGRPARGSPGDSPGAGGTSAEAEDELPDWKILF